METFEEPNLSPGTKPDCSVFDNLTDSDLQILSIVYANSGNMAQLVLCRDLQAIRKKDRDIIKSNIKVFPTNNISFLPEQPCNN